MYQNYNQNQNMMYGNQAPLVPKMTQPLTPEQIKDLRTNSSQFQIELSQFDINKAICTHKENGNIVLRENGDGSVTCNICGANFNLVETDIEQVQECTRMFMNILQTIKTYFLDLPEEYIHQIFRILPVVEKIPHIYYLALNSFKKYTRDNTMNQGGYMGSFNLYNAVAGGVPMGMNPMMMNNPAMMNQAMMNPNMMSGQMMGGSPMMTDQYGNMQYPANPGMGYNPFIQQQGFNPQYQQQQYGQQGYNPNYQPQQQQQGQQQSCAPQNQQQGDKIITTKNFGND